MSTKSHKKIKITKEQELLDQKAIWYKKLEQSGFKDIEKDEHRLKQWSSKLNTDVVRRNWEAKNEYYSMARRFLNNYKFESNLEKNIWAYHAEGISARNISKLLKKVRINKYFVTISVITRRLAYEMKKMYIPGFK